MTVSRWLPSSRRTWLVLSGQRGSIAMYIVVPGWLVSVDVGWLVGRSGQYGSIVMCLVVPCCLVLVDGGWSEWTVWTDCSVTCSNGSQSRNRTCNNPVPVENGLDCDGEPTSAQDCNTNIPCGSTFVSVSFCHNCFISLYTDVHFL